MEDGKYLVHDIYLGRTLPTEPYGQLENDRLVHTLDWINDDMPYIQAEARRNPRNCCERFDLEEHHCAAQASQRG